MSGPQFLNLWTLAFLAFGTAGCFEQPSRDSHSPTSVESPESTKSAPFETAAPVTLSDKVMQVYLEQVQLADRFADDFSRLVASGAECEEIVLAIEASISDLRLAGQRSLDRVSAMLDGIEDLDHDIAWRSLRGLSAHHQSRLSLDPRLRLGQLRGQCPDQATSIETVGADAIATLEAIASKVNRASSERPLLFRIAREGRGDFYLFGSIHAGSASLFPLPAEVESAYSQASVVAIEALEDGSGAASNLQKLLGNPGGKRLSRVIPPELYSRLEETLRVTGVPNEAVRDLRPLAVAYILLQRSGGPTGLISSAGMEAHFLRQADRDDKKVIALETPQEQLSALFHGRPGSPLEVRALEVAIEEASRIDGQTLRLVSAWRRGDEAELAKVRTFWSDMDPALRVYDEAFMDRRDARMAARIQRLMRDNRSYFIIVGAAHLVGENSIVTRLRSRGLEVERI